jgi:16S rRNA processing protein RimM
VSEEPEYLVVGEIVGAFGTKGEVKLKPETQFPERFKPGASVWLGADKSEHTIESARFHHPHILVKFQGVDTMDEAEQLRGEVAYVPIAMAVSLEEGSFYHYQLIDLEVITDKGLSLGRVTDVLTTGSNDVFVVRGDLGEILIPATKEVVKSISPKDGKIMIIPLEGLIPTDDHED